jgi:head-tail adaptor
MIGPRVTCYLRRPETTQDDYGSRTTSWINVCEFKGVFTTLSKSEQVFADRESVFADYNLFVGRAAMRPYQNYLHENARIYIGQIAYNIIGVNNYFKRMYQIGLRRIK